MSKILFLAVQIFSAAAFLPAQILQPGQDLNTIDYTELTKHGTAKDFQYLLDQGMHFHQPAGNGSTWLMGLAGLNNTDPDIVPILTKDGVDIDAADSTGNTALTQAIGHGNEVYVKALIANGADVNKTVGKSVSPLRLAVAFATTRGFADPQSPSSSILKELIEAGADVNQIGGTGNPIAFELAVLPWLGELLPLLVSKGLDLTLHSPVANYSTAAGGSLLMMAVKNAAVSPEVVSLMIDHGANVNELDQTGKSALVYAASFTHDPGVVRVLLDAGADPNPGSFHAVEFARNNKFLSDDSIVKALGPQEEGSAAEPASTLAESNASALPAAIAEPVEVSSKPNDPDVVDSESKLLALFAETLDRGESRFEFLESLGLSSTKLRAYWAKASSASRKGGLYQTGSDFSIEGVDQGRQRVSALVHYAFPDGQVEQIVEQVDKKAQAVVNLVVKPGMSDYQKELALNDWLVENSHYDDANYSANTVPKSEYTPYGVLMLGTGVCESYADAFYVLAAKAGLESRIVSGTSRGEAHAWNQVKVQGDWYNLDVTWDNSGTGGRPSTDQLKHAYFNLDDRTLALNHTWDSSTAESCTATAANWFVQNKLVCRNYEAFGALVKQAINKRQKSLGVEVAQYDPSSFPHDIAATLNNVLRGQGVRVSVSMALDPDLGIVSLLFTY